MHIKYTGVCVPGPALTHLCFFYFGAPFLGAAGGQAPYTLASCCPEPRRLLGGATLWGGQVVLSPVLFTVSALTLSGNLSSPPKPPTPTSSIICSRPYFGPRLQGRWGVLGNIQDNSKAFSHFLPSEIGTFPILQQRSGGNQFATLIYYVIHLFQCKQKTLSEGFVMSQVSFCTLMRFGCR